MRTKNLEPNHQTRLLHCCGSTRGGGRRTRKSVSPTLVQCYWPGGGSRGGREAEPITFTIELTGQSLVFSLPHLLVAEGWLAPDAGASPVAAAGARWNRSLERFYTELEARTGLTPAALQQHAAPPRQAIIGWDFAGRHQPAVPAQLCRDLPLAVAVLARSAGHIYFRGREPEYRWETLFEQQLVLEDAALLDAPPEAAGTGGGR